MRCLIAALALLTLAGPAHAICDPAARGRAIEVDVSPVELGYSDWRGLEHLGTVELTSDNGAFGGLSGLLIENKGARMIAVSDRGRWFTAFVERDRTGVTTGLVAPSLTTMRWKRGELTGKRRDAEGLARLGDSILVSFERIHRIMACSEQSRLDEFLKLEDWGDLEYNASLESVAVLPDGRVFAVAEAPDSTYGFPFWVIDPREGGADPIAGHIPQEDRHHVTDAAIAPDGKYYVLERHYSPLTGVDVRVVRYWPDRRGLPDPPTWELLARWDSTSGIDNMEGLALWTDALGRLRLTLVADDNFSGIQRTLLIDTVVRRP